MPHDLLETPQVKNLKDFYDLMAATRDVRARAVQAVFGEEAMGTQLVQSLKNAHAALTGLARGYSATLPITGGRSGDLDLTYEITELERDIVYLEEGEESLMELLGRTHPGFEDQIREAGESLAGLDFNCMITDRDGTTNNYCGRYRSSVQSAYNAVFLTRFARAKVRNPVFITSAPLSDMGIVDISVNPAGSFIYGASKGRECLDLEGRRHSFPIDPGQQRLLDELNRRLSDLLDEPRYQKFGLIGSGLQFKFGQTTVARQDISQSVPPEESRAFLATLRRLVDEVDPADAFRIEDTGLDVEIILTVKGEGSVKDFDKGDGVAFMNKELELGMEYGPHLVCGDTASDLPLITSSLELSADTHAVFVTRKEDLARKVREASPHAVIVPEPDVLVAMLGRVLAGAS
jgi:hypothetical protein